MQQQGWRAGERRGGGAAETIWRCVISGHRASRARARARARASLSRRRRHVLLAFHGKHSTKKQLIRSR